MYVVKRFQEFLLLRKYDMKLADEDERLEELGELTKQLWKRQEKLKSTWK